MKKLVSFLSIVALLSACSGGKQASMGHLQYVDPFIGTTYTGHTFPCAVYPFGMMQPGPQTGCIGWDYYGGYRYEDTIMQGFSQNRLNGTGCPDMGDLLMMPFCGKSTAEGFKSTFSKDSEVATPGYYAVQLADNSVKVELTTTPHVALHRYTFGKKNPAVYINFQSGVVGSQDGYDRRVLRCEVQQEDEYTISGYQRINGWVERDLYFVVRFDKPVLSIEDVKGAKEGEVPGKLLRFADEKEMMAKVAISMVGIDNAKRNIESELRDWDFEAVKENVENKWENYLSRIDIEGTDDQKTNFYTALYHTLIQPNNIADTDGRYRNSKDSVAMSPFGKYFSTYSLWDTYRAAHPLYTLFTPEMVPAMVNTMLLHAEQYGYLPIWPIWGKETHCMVGNHGIPVVVEACLKDFPDIDPEWAYEWVKKSLLTPHKDYAADLYAKYGYLPFDLVKNESVSRTLEGGYDDYCAALLAKKLGKEDDYAFFMERSRYYKNLFDAETGLMRGKDSKGRWRTPFDAFHLSHASTIGGDYTEGNAWQYTWHVQQDIDGLVELLGGTEKTLAKLDSLFVLDTRVEQEGFVKDVTGLIGQYAHGNEPSHHVIYMYSMLGRNDRTAELVREVFDRFYLPTPDGLCGNDDCGQMSAWYVFSAMGFYPVDPASLEYVIGAPQLPKASIKLSNGKTFTMIAHNLSKENKYVKSVKMNGQELEDFTFTYADLMNGGTLEFEMSDVK